MPLDLLFILCKEKMVRIDCVRIRKFEDFFLFSYLPELEKVY